MPTSYSTDGVYPEIYLPFVERPGTVQYLILNSTNWAIGQKWVHLQVLCMIYHNIAIPIFWRDLNHDGHSNGLERQELLRDAARLFDLKGKVLLADCDGAARAVRW